MNHFNKPSIDNKLNTVLVAVFVAIILAGGYDAFNADATTASATVAQAPAPATATPTTTVVASR
jgi:hypothetical protein